MSRPKGSKNKKKSPAKVAKIIKRKVGRPKKANKVNKVKSKKKVGRPKKVKTVKKRLKQPKRGNIGLYITKKGYSLIGMVKPKRFINIGVVIIRFIAYVRKGGVR